ncbi:MAG: CD225/dispanin family protein [Bacteroidaceae bacterium]|nr:CD225/dispanin family protein [Bacteroidaceae bacterium]
MRICPKCGFRIENDNALFCRKCGTQLPVVEPDTESESTNNAVMPEDAPQYSQDTPQYNQDTPQYGQDAPEYSQTTPPFNQGSTNNQGTTEYGQDSTEYGQGSTEYGPTPRYTVEEGDMKMAEDTGSGISQENGDDNVRFYDEDDPVAVTPPPPPPLYGNESYGTSGYSQQTQESGYTSQPYQPEYTTQQPYNDYQPKKPENHLLKAILSTVLCIPIIGIVAIVYAAQTDSCYTQGLYEEAEEKARKANSWANASIAIGLVLFFIVALFILFAILFENNY